MSISIFIPLVVPLMLGPIWTHHLFEKLFQRERKMIALDNAAILMGRDERSFFEVVRMANQEVSYLEKIHHPIHFLAGLTGASPEVIAQDQKLEAMIRELHDRAGRIAKSSWAQGKVSAQEEFLRMGLTQFEINRHPEHPIQADPCPICHLMFYWKLRTDFRESSIGIRDEFAISDLKIHFPQINLNSSTKTNFQIKNN